MKLTRRRRKALRIYGYRKLLGRCRKRHFRTQDEADAEVPKVSGLHWGTFSRDRKKGQLRSYYCDDCEAWHIGHYTRMGAHYRALADQGEEDDGILDRSGEGDRGQHSRPRTRPIPQR